MWFLLQLMSMWCLSTQVKPMCLSWKICIKYKVELGKEFGSWALLQFEEIYLKVYLSKEIAWPSPSSSKGQRDMMLLASSSVGRTQQTARPK